MVSPIFERGYTPTGGPQGGAPPPPPPVKKTQVPSTRHIIFSYSSYYRERETHMQHSRAAGSRLLVPAHPPSRRTTHVLSVPIRLTNHSVSGNAELVLRILCSRRI